MADDIDIEEHDVLEHPAIRNIFPDISVVKKELSQYYEDVPDIKQEPEITTTTNKLLEKQVVRTKPDESIRQVHEKKIGKNVSSGLTASNSENSKIQNNKWEAPFLGTKIILGSKPNKTVEKIQGKEAYVNKKTNISLKSVVPIPKLLLQDVGEYIFTSNRYCEDCKTLFSSKSKFQEHKLKFHSVIPQYKSTISKVTVETASADENNKCNICGSCFSCKSSLNRHYKNIHSKIMTNNDNHTIKALRVESIDKTKSTPSKCEFVEIDHSCKNNENIIRTRNKRLNVKVILQEPKSKKKLNKPQIKQNALINKNKCTICGSYFSNEANLYRHYKNIHKKVSIKSKPQIKHNALINKNKCTICGSYFSKEANLNRHYKNIHKKVSIKPKYKNDKLLDRVSNTSRMALLSKATRLQTKIAKPETKNVCFHCNEQFHDQKCLIEHMYTVLGRKRYSKRKRSEILTRVKEKHSSPTKTVNRELGCTESKRISLKDKLIFENQDSDDSELEREKHKCDDFEKTMEQFKMHTTSTTLQKEQTENITVAKSRSSDRFSPKTERNKRNQDFSDASSWSFLDTYKTICENHVSDQSMLSSKTEKIKSVDFETSTESKAMHTILSTTLEETRTESITDDESRSSDQSNHKTLRNKRKHDLSDDANSTDYSFADTNNSNENHSFNDIKRKFKTRHLHTSKSSTKNNAIIAPSDTCNKQRTLRTKTANSKNRLCIKISKNETGVSLQSNISKKYELNGFIYQCIFCSFILPSARSYCMHMFWRHKLDNVTRVNKAIFDTQCKYCPARNSKKNHNRHIRMRHNDLFTEPHKNEAEDCEKKEATKLKNLEFKKVESFVLKSIVYKCAKCDIHFLSSCVAKDHDKHMELLINWKCSICKKIFKKHDKHLHLKQHRFSKTVNVCQFDQSELSRILYSCTKCGIHFTEERYLEHFSKCNNQTTDSVYCKHCDILIDKCGFVTHEAYHKTSKNNVDIIVITGDIITKNQEKSKNQEEEDQIETAKYSPINCLTFCQTCKCYLSDIAVNRKSHVEGRCFKMVKYTCPTCGLVFTNKTINTHRDHHKKEKGLKLQDFEFFDLNGIQIRPPIPEYPACNNCEVIFVGKNAIKNHVCSDTEYLTCEICKVKLSENAFKLHMNFHRYCMPNEKIDQPLNLVLRESLQNDIELDNHVRALHPNVCAAMPKTDTSQAVVQIESQEHTVKVDNYTATSSLLLCDTVLKAKTDNSLSVEATQSLPIVKNPSINIVAKREVTEIADNNAMSNTILYTCQSCKISVDTYDKVILHCQNHFSSNPTILSSKQCPKCLLQLEMDTYKIHQKFDFSCDKIQALTFDPTYFTSDNDIWTQHIFSSVSLAIQREAIEKSMYQHECRFKMEVFQQGPSYLTVYQCYKCSIFFEPHCFVSHIGGGCHKNNRVKHPCSVCGLPFYSSLSRVKHEKIHEQHDNIRLKSYNIILINHESHTSYNISILNAMKKYILYQCRTCDGIVDKSQCNDHKCNVDDLQKCSICGLLLYKDDFERHILKHSDLPMYSTANIKVILFGYKDESIINKSLSSTFNGAVYDYNLYKCSKCEQCENDYKLISRHICTLDDSKWKCPKCGYYISGRSIKQHIKIHDVDAEFKTENFTIISFHPTKSNSKKNNCVDNNNQTLNKQKFDSDTGPVDTELGKNPVKIQAVTANVSENTNNNRNKESIVLYKCACGLHYMDEMVAKNHANHCCPKMKIIRQNCSKCSLTFNPKELFSHIIMAHQGDKNKTFKYNIIEVKAEI